MRQPVTPPLSGARRAPAANDHRPGGPATAARPVFVDPSGRRQRRVRRLGWLLAIPAAGYVALLLSSAFGGPSVDSPYLPLPAAGAHGADAATPRPSSPGAAHRTPSAAGNGVSASGSPTARASAAAAPAARPSQHPSAAAGATTPADAIASATAAPTATHGRSTATHPVPTHTARGRG